MTTAQPLTSPSLTWNSCSRAAVAQGLEVVAPVPTYLPARQSREESARQCREESARQSSSRRSREESGLSTCLYARHGKVHSSIQRVIVSST
jgi:hypothetical protein